MLDTALLNALASPRRREILRLCWEEERAAGDIAAALPDVTFGAISLQLRVLAEAGLVDRRVEGRNRYYKARRAALGPVATHLARTWDHALWRLKLLAELDETRRGPLPRRRRHRRERRRERRP